MGKLEKTKIPLIDEKGKQHNYRVKKQKDLTRKHKFDTLFKVEHNKTNRKDNMKNIQRYVSLVLLSAGCIFGITQYTSDISVVVGGTLLVGLLVEKAK